MHERLDIQPSRPSGRSDVVVVSPEQGRGSPFLKALRPKQWIKNLLVFAAPGAAGILGRPEMLARGALAFVAMCAAASATYLINDVVDAQADRSHPAKRYRPVACGALSTRAAVVGSLVLFASSFALGAALGPAFLVVALAYAAVTTAYTMALQREPVFDILAVAACFVLRAVAGGAATHVTPSAWFLILTSAGALFVVSGKRLADLGEPPTRGDRSYPDGYLRGVWILSAAVAVTAYCLWAVAVPHIVDGVSWSQISIVPFAAAVLRYGYVIELGAGGAPEEVFLHDRALQAAVLVWLVVYAVGVYIT